MAFSSRSRRTTRSKLPADATEHPHVVRIDVDRVEPVSDSVVDHVRAGHADEEVGVLVVRVGEGAGAAQIGEAGVVDAVQPARLVFIYPAECALQLETEVRAEIEDLRDATVQVEAISLVEVV